jgi:Ca2+-binding RTX toxin-like protein
MRITHGVLVGVLAITPALLSAPSQALAETCRGLPVTIHGTTDGDDEVAGTPLDDVVSLGAGNDRFNDIGGNDVICAGPGRDTINGGPGNDFIDGGAGNDRIAGGAGDDRIHGGSGNDAITPGDGNDVVRAEKGKDYIAEGGGNDKISGGPGKDYVTYLYWNRRIKVTRAHNVTGAGRDLLANVETIEGTGFADVMRGSPGDDDLRGGGGKDQIYGLGGNDVLFASDGVARGGAGNDYIRLTGRATGLGGPGSDELALGTGKSVRAYGGGAADTFRVVSNQARGFVHGEGADNQLNFSSHKRAVRVDIGAGRASWRGGSLRIRNINNVLGSRRRDVLLGGPGNDYMDGFKGGDTLKGRGGNDFLVGKGGFDKGDGGPGWDICLTEIKKNCP